MTPVVALAHPANWRSFYQKKPCLCCGFRALFHEDTALPICDDCVKATVRPRRIPAVDHGDVLKSEILYHGAEFGDDQ